MNNMQRLVDAIDESARIERSRYHLTLGMLISELELVPTDFEVWFQGGGTKIGWGQFPGKLLSYRGYYSDLAFTPVNREVKAGDFTMTETTPLWVAEWGDASDIAVVDFKPRAYSNASVLVLRELN